MARKKEVRKQEYHTLPKCFGNSHQLAGKWTNVFDNTHPLTFELGCGRAEFSFGMAQRYPNRNFVGVDLKAARMWRPAVDAQQAGITNLAFLCANLLEIDQYVAENEADELWITFPDPFPKKRQAKHRMINANFLSLYRKILKPGGKLHIKTDNLDLFHFGLETFVREKELQIEVLTFDLHNCEDVNPDSKIRTTYEKMFIEMGKKINYIRMSFDSA